MKNRGVSLAIVVLMIGLIAFPAAASSVDPRFEVFVDDPVVEPGQETVVTVQLINDAEDADDVAETAHEVRASMRSGETPITVQSGTRLVGDLEDSVPHELQFRITVPRDVESGTYHLPIDIDYEFEDETEHKTVLVPIEVESAARFSVNTTETSANIGDTGTLTLSMDNVGGETAHNARVVVESTDAELSFGVGNPSSEGFVGHWDAGETKLLDFKVNVAETAIRRNYSILVTVHFDDRNGLARSHTVSAGVQPRPRQSFEVDEMVTTSLTVGSTATIEARLTNTGESVVRDAVVILQTEGTDVSSRVVEYPAGDLGPGESTPVRFTVDVPDDAVPGPRRIGFLVRYENEAGDTLESEPISGRVEVRERQPAFKISPINTTFAVDSTGLLEVELTNVLDEPITDVSATLTTTTPLETMDESAYIGSLAPGESTRLTFELEVTDDAVPKSYPIQLNVSYRDGGGTLKDAGPYRVGITAVESAEPPVPILPVVAIVVVIVIGAGWWYRRR